MKTCIQCGRVRTAEDDETTPEWKCPACGVAYIKAEMARVAESPPRNAAGASPIHDLKMRASIRRGAIGWAVIILSIATLLVVGGSEAASGLLSLGVLVFAAAVYFLPTLLARERKHPQAQAIFVLNLFVGWTFIGWVGAMVWAFVNPARPGG